MLKNLVLPVILLLTALFIPLDQTRAHELKSSNAIRALIHINPDDDPIAGQSSEILFLISDKDKKFQAENCNCVASVLKNDEVLFTSPLFKGQTSYRGIFAPAIPFTFPNKGVYTIQLTGEPKEENLFQKFSITYNLRIDKDADTPPAPPFKKTLSYIITIGILIGIIYFIKLFFIKKLN